MLIEKIPLGSMTYLGAPFQVADDFCWCWGQLIQFNNEYVCRPDEYIHLDRSVTTDRSASRNILRRKFLGDWILMLDADMVYQPDLLLRMLVLFEGGKLDVLTGIYNSKTPPYPPMIQWRDDSSEYTKNKWRIITGWKPDVRLIEVRRSGAGCLMVRRKVFDRIDSELGEEPFTNKDGASEDFSFFARLERLGIRAFAATQIQLGHLVMRSVGMKNFRPNVLEQVMAQEPPQIYREDAVSMEE